MKNIFEQSVSNEVINRLNQLNVNSAAEWGTMNASQMLAHCNVTYEMVYENIHPKPNFLKRFMLKLFVKSVVVSEKPYKKKQLDRQRF